jgi:hypothetical protein
MHLLFALGATGQQLRVGRQVDGVFVPLQHLQRLAVGALQNVLALNVPQIHTPRQRQVLSDQCPIMGRCAPSRRNLSDRLPCVGARSYRRQDGSHFL